MGVSLLPGWFADYRGGLHLLFSQQPKHTALIPKTSEGRPADMKALIEWMRRNILSEREDMFCEGDSV